MVVARTPLAIALLLAGLALAFASWGLVRLNTWYLASDQFAFLTLAEDLRRGTVFHDDASLELIQPRPIAGWAYDALAQTYYWRDGRLYTRYPPGFPVLLAAADAVGGESAQHALNPLLYLVTLVVLGALGGTLVAERSRTLALGAAVGSMWLLLLLPTRVHLWGITVARDLPAHLLALIALLAAARRRPVASGVALGLACTVRPDAFLYAVSLVAIFALTRPSRRALAGAAVAFAVCASPVLLYNLVVEGSLFSFTQGSEFRDWLAARPLGDGIVLVSPFIRPEVMPSGGAFRLSNLATTLPANALYLVGAFGWFSALILAAIVWGLVRQRLLVAALLPYAVVGLLFYGCWSHPDARYLAGVAACLVPLAAVGSALVCRLAARAGPALRLTAALVASVPLARVAGFGVGWIPAPGRAGTALAAAVVAVALGALAFRSERRGRLAPLAPAVAFAALGVVLVAGSRGARDPFQRPQVERARAAIAARIPPGSLVVTTSTLGRPAENLRHYSGVEAFYKEELPLLRLNGDFAAVRFLLAGRRAFYLLDARDRETTKRLKRGAEVRRVEHRRGGDLLEWYVDPRRAPAGAVLYEIRLTAEQERTIRRFVEESDAYFREQDRRDAEPREPEPGTRLWPDPPRTS